MPTLVLTETFGAFFAIMNPFVTLPIFLVLTTGLTVAEQRALAVKVVLFSAIMCAVILLAGTEIIGFFGLSVDQFRIAGGAVLVKISWSLLNGEGAVKRPDAAAVRTQIVDLNALAFYPMTFPMIVGPGSIVTLIVYGTNADGAAELLQVGAIVGAILLMLLVVFFFASVFGRVLSETMQGIMSRLMGLILLSIAVAMIVEALLEFFPGWAAA